MHVELRSAGHFLSTHFSHMMAKEEPNVPSKIGEDLGKVGEISERAENASTSLGVDEVHRK